MNLKACARFARGEGREAGRPDGNGHRRHNHGLREGPQGRQPDRGEVPEPAENGGGKEKYSRAVIGDERFRRLRSGTAELINAVANLKIEIEDDGKEEVDMCKAMRERHEISLLKLIFIRFVEELLRG